MGRFTVNQMETGVLRALPDSGSSAANLVNPMIQQKMGHDYAKRQQDLDRARAYSQDAADYAARGQMEEAKKAENRAGMMEYDYYDIQDPSGKIRTPMRNPFVGANQNYANYWTATGNSPSPFSPELFTEQRMSEFNQNQSQPLPPFNQPQQGSQQPSRQVPLTPFYPAGNRPQAIGANYLPPQYQLNNLISQGRVPSYNNRPLMFGGGR